MARGRGLARRYFSIEQASDNLAFILENVDELDSFYRLLQDDYSRQLLISLLEFKVIGAQHVKLPINDKQYWDKYNSIDRHFLKERSTVKTWRNWHLNRYQLQGLSGPVNVHAHPLGILNSFVLQRYA